MFNLWLLNKGGWYKTIEGTQVKLCTMICQFVQVYRIVLVHHKNHFMLNSSLRVACVHMLLFTLKQIQARKEKVGKEMRTGGTKDAGLNDCSCCRTRENKQPLMILNEVHTRMRNI